MLPMWKYPLSISNIRLGIGCWILSICTLAYCSETAAAAIAAPWIDERISTACDTGGWSRDVLYNRTYATAVFDGGEYVYTPNAASDGRFVTVETVTTFPVCETSAPLDREAQAAICLGKNGSFRIWSKAGWVAVSAPGVAAVAGWEYTLSFVFDYEKGVYSVSVMDGTGAWRLMCSERKEHSFPLAAKAKRISSISYDGYTTFRSLRGQCTRFVSSAAIDASDDGRKDHAQKLPPPTAVGTSPRENWRLRPQSETPRTEFKVCDRGRRDRAQNLAPPTAVGSATRKNRALRRLSEG